MAGGQNVLFGGGKQQYLENQVLMTGFLTRQMPVPPFLATGGAFAFDLEAVYHYYFVSAGYAKVLRAPMALGSEAPLYGTWVPQGGSAVLPLNPTGRGGGGGSSLVLTAELTGCSLVLDRTAAGLKIYHVQPNRMMREYHAVRNVLQDNQVELLGPDEYDATSHNVNAVVYFENGAWRLTYQRWTGAFINQISGAYIDNFRHVDTVTRAINV